MNKIVTTLLIAMLSLVGCEDVQFSPTVDEEHNASGDPVTPVNPTGPVVKIVQAPSDHNIEEDTQVIFQVVKGSHEIAEVQCYINSVELNCDWIKGILKLVRMPLGLHWVEIVAIDTEGLVGKAKESWSVFDHYVRKSESIDVNRGAGDTDILFVIDNSSSMRYEQTQISQRFHNFMDQVKDLDWNIGITTTDAHHNKTYGDGKLDPFPNGDWYLTPELGMQYAQQLFSEHVQREESGSDTEKGIRAVYRAIERSVANRYKEDRALHSFFRRNAALAVVVV